MTQLIERLQRQTYLPGPDDHVLFAVSGGADSVAGLLLLDAIRNRGSETFSLHAGHVVHDLRENGPERDRAFVENLCRKRNIPLHTVSVSIRSDKQTGSEEAIARRKRYEALASIAQNESIGTICTGHHQNDQIETLLMRIKHGTGIFGLAGIRKTRPLYQADEQQSPTLLRPLLAFTKQELLNFLQSRKQSWQTDSSNTDLRYTRNWIRHRLIPLLDKTCSSPWRKKLLSIQSRASRIRKRVRSRWKQIQQQLSPVMMSTEGKILYGREMLQRMSPLLYWFLLRDIQTRLHDAPAFVRQADIRRLSRLLSRNQTGMEETVTHHIHLRLEHDHLCVWRKPSDHTAQTGQSPPEVTALSQHFSPASSLDKHFTWNDWTITFKTRSREEIAVPAIKDDPLQEIMDASTFNPPVSISARKSGDALQPLGMNGSKTIKEIMIDQKIAKSFRATWPIVRDQTGPIWVVGLKLSDRVKIQECSSSLLQVQANPPSNNII